MKDNIKPTESELEVLQVLWQYGPSTVRYVNDKLNEKKAVGYTTTLKIMQIMTEKNLVQRNEENRSHVYEPLVKEEETKKHLLDKFLEHTFKGSAMNMVMQLLGNSKTSKEELDKIKELIQKLEGENK